MRRLMMAAAAAAAVLTASAGGALAAPPAVPAPLGGAPRHAAERVQYYGDWHAQGDWEEHRWHRRQQRRAHEEARIAEAARREAWRIEQERAERRAWRHAQRERFGYGPGYHRGF